MLSEPLRQGPRAATTRVAAAICACAFAGCFDLAPIELAEHTKAAVSDDASQDIAEPDEPTGPTTPTEPSTPDGPWHPTTRRYHIELTWHRSMTSELPTVPGGAVGEADGAAEPTSPALPTGPDPQTPGGEAAVPDFGTDLEPDFDCGLDADRELGAPSGADLDLHFLHPYAVGRDLDGDGASDGWFDVPFDVHWANPSPTWGKTGSDDDGRLDRDDRLGPGPEVVSLDHCDHEGFTIGVHAFTDPLGAPTEARIDVYLDGAPTFSATTRLLHQDFWEVGTLRCDGRVDRLGRIIPAVAISGSQG